MKIHIIAVLHRYRGIFFKELVSHSVIFETLEVSRPEDITQAIQGWVMVVLKNNEEHVLGSISHTVLPEGQ